MDDAVRALHGRAELLPRVAQLHSETRFVHAAGDALAIGDLFGLGAIVDASQSTAVRLLGNQVPETIALAQSARELGAVAASAFGAGFGGSVYALVDTAGAEEFRHRWVKAYSAAFPNRGADATFFVTRAGPPATSL
jgi:galactokinase